ncbi:MAG: hypothetical protein RMK57_15795 [Bryobacterales bacterium]|nr:peroxiredoxin family protein [Bryobacteraceae bacterium]MDW8355985.1 hypothetical protein [Bryobacterales bacterium]
MKLRRGDFLPDLTLPSIGDRAAVALRPTLGRTTVLFVPDLEGCPPCQRYLDELVALAEEFAVWEARLLVAVRPPLAYRLPHFAIPVQDADERFAGAHLPAVLVADRYGQLWDAVSAGASHRFPPSRDLAEWVKYLATLCPE